METPALYVVADWLKAIDAELAAENQNHHRISHLFKQALPAIRSPHVYRRYLDYVRRKHALQAQFDQQNRSVLQQAYEFVLLALAHDYEAAGELWLEWLALARSQQVNSAFEEQQKTELVRSLYQRAVVLPSTCIEQLWKDWDMYENGLTGNNKVTTKKLLAEKSPQYMTARAALRQLRQLYDRIDRNHHLRQILDPPSWSPHERDQLQRWLRVISWERSNPLNISDPDLLFTRVQWTYWQALLSMPTFPQLWHSFATYCMDQNKSGEALLLLQRACEQCDDSYLLHFALADHAELCKDLQIAKDSYESLITTLTTQMNEIHSQFNIAIDQLTSSSTTTSTTLPDSSSSLSSSAIAATTTTPTATAVNLSVPSLPIQNQSSTTDYDDDVQHLRNLHKRLDAQKLKLEQDRHLALRDSQNGLSLTWIQYMRHTLRAHGIKEMRAIFKRARSHPHTTWHVIVASAWMEYHQTKDPTVPRRLFAFAITQFPKRTSPILAFADFLLSVGDNINFSSIMLKAMQQSINSPESHNLQSLPNSNDLTSSLTRRGIQSLDNFESDSLLKLNGMQQFDIESIPDNIDDMKPIWDKFLKFHSHYGDLTTVFKHEQEMSQIYPTITHLDHALRRYSFLDINVIRIHDLGLSTTPNITTSVSSTNNSSVGLSRPTTMTSATAPEDLYKLPVSERTDTSKRRILDEWQAPHNAFPMPDIASGRSKWIPYRPSKLTQEEEARVIQRERGSRPLFPMTINGGNAQDLDDDNDSDVTDVQQMTVQSRGPGLRRNDVTRDRARDFRARDRDWERERDDSPVPSTLSAGANYYPNGVGNDIQPSSKLLLSSVLYEFISILPPAHTYNGMILSVPALVEKLQEVASVPTLEYRIRPDLRKRRTEDGSSSGSGSIDPRVRGGGATGGGGGPMQKRYRA